MKHNKKMESKVTQYLLFENMFFNYTLNNTLVRNSKG